MGRCGPSCSPYNGLLRWTLLLLVVSGASLSQAGTVHRQDDGPVTYTDQWAVHIEGGQQVADEIARRNDFINLGKIVGDYYHFQHRKLAKRSTEAAANHEEGLNSESQVRWIKQQVVKHRSKRDLIDLDPPPNNRREERSRDQSGQGGTRASRRAGSSAIRARSVSVNLNDPRWTQMWYLNRGMGLDMNVQEAWAEGVTGRGIVVTILDDGLEKDHPDIRRNYDPQASYDVNGHDDDPMPRYDLIDSNRHGTRCAGEVAAEGNNSICAVGVAYDAGIGGVRMLDGDVTDAVEARSLSLNPHHIDIYSASWGPDDDGKTVDGPGELATRAFIEGVTKGRSGKGSIFVWASGNGGRDHDNCNCDGYTNSIWTLSISSATENGYVPWYSEACSSTLATTYSSGSSGEKQIVTTDLHHSCTASHTGTSASAPLAAGICALALEANRNLTWRDMQHIVVRTAKPANLKADDWQVNGVGRNVSHSFGYGLMDAAAMVRVARVWNTVPPQQFCEIRAPDSNKLIPAKSQVQIQLHVSECSGVNYMEHVQARITLAAVSRGDIQIHLSSPFGTRSTLLALRPHDSSRNGFHSWPFMSVHYWGESPFGVWTLEIQNEGRYLGRANLQEWVLRIHGTRTDPGRSMRSSSTGGSSGRGSQGQSTSATLSKASNGAPSSISNQKAITTPLAMLTPTSAVVTIPAANESVVSIPVIPGSGTTATWDPSGTAAAKDGGSNQGQVKGGHNIALDVGPRHDSVLRSKTATLSEWNVVIYGTKENPDAKNRAAAPALPSGIGIVSNNLSAASAASSAPATTSSSAKLQPNLDKELSRLNDADRLEGGFINRKPSQHQNLEENRASVFTNPESPVPVLSSASSSAASRCLPTHWDPTAAICLMCQSGVYLWRGQCVYECPATSYPVNQTLLDQQGNVNGLCLPCHYSCLNCSGPADSECTKCHADAELRSSPSTGFGGARDQFCHPKVLVEQLTHYEHWTLGTEIALAFNIALVVALCGYLLCSGKYGCNSSCRMSCCGGRNSRQPNYQNLISAVPSSRSKGAALNAQYSDRAPEAGPCIQADMSSDEEI